MTMDIQFREIDKSNYEDCVSLEVLDEQKEFVASNSWSLLEAKYEDGERRPLAICNGDEIVGFLMYTYYPADQDYPRDSWWLERFMIDKKHQKRGYGRESLARFLDHAREELVGMELRTSAEPSNSVAIELYEKAGFRRTGEVAAGEVVLLIQL